MHLKKYVTLFWLSGSARRDAQRLSCSSARAASRSCCPSVYLWSALLENQTSVLGYTRQDLLTHYVLLMTLLRAWVLRLRDGPDSDGNSEKGKLSEVLCSSRCHTLVIGFPKIWASESLNIEVRRRGSGIVRMAGESAAPRRPRRSRRGFLGLRSPRCSA